MSADVARGHGGDSSGDDRPPPYQLPTGCGMRASRLHTRQETQDLGLNAITDMSGPIPIQFEVDDRETLDAFGNKQYKSEDTQELFRELFNDVQNIREELAEYINTPGWNRPAFYNNGDDDDEDCNITITSDFLITDSLSMGDEHVNTIPEKESDEFINSCVEALVPIPSKSEDFSDIESECDVPDCDDFQTKHFSTFSNPLFDDSTSSDDESSHEEDIHE
nr:hypothetical protein [Tanacetum cinerariifolium]